MKKILIATGIFPPDIGGPATYSKLLLDELPKRGIEVRVLSFGSVRHLPKVIRHFIYFCKALAAGAGTDVIFAQDPVSVGLPSALAAKILGKKFVLKIVGDYAWEQYCQRSKASLEFPISSDKVESPRQSRDNFQFPNLEEFQDGKFDFMTELRRKIQRWVAKRAEKIIVPSEYLKKIILQWGVGDIKIQIIYNAAQQQVKQEQFLSTNKDYLLSVGRLVPWKGFETLIETMTELPAEMKLMIIGSGPQEENLKFKVRSLKLEERIKIMGQVPHEELSNYFAKARIFVLNTGYEGLSHIVLEAMAQGVPVITTNIGGNPELIKNGENGISVEYNNRSQLKEAILKLWFDQNLQQKFIQNSFKALEKFTLERMINQTIEVLQL